MATVLITGVSGFVGSHVLEAVLDSTDHDVIGIASWRHNGSPSNVVDVLATDPRIANRARIVTHDMAAPFATEHRRLLAYVDYVIDVASRCSVDQSIDTPDTFIRNNIDVTLNLLEWCRRRPRQPFHRIVHVSTDEVYGPQRGEFAVQENGHRPSSPYAASKAMQEDLCHAYRTTYALPITLVNSANMFGERQSKLAFIPKAIRALHRGEPVTVHAHLGQFGVRWYSYVRNVALRVAGLLDGKPPNRFALSGQHRLNNLELARAVATAMDIPFDHTHYRIIDADTVRPGYDPNYVDLPTGHRHWAEGLTTFQDGLQATVDWALSDPSWMDE